MRPSICSHEGCSRAPRFAAESAASLPTQSAIVQTVSLSRKAALVRCAGTLTMVTWSWPKSSSLSQTLRQRSAPSRPRAVQAALPLSMPSIRPL
eukprot:181569-Heterocapsa_arctica.AAC.1